MKEISLKRAPEKPGKPEAVALMMDSYPSFHIHDDAPAEIVKHDIGKVYDAKIKLTSKSVHEGDKKRMSVGFDVLSVMVDDGDAKTKEARGKGAEIAAKIKKEGIEP